MLQISTCYAEINKELIKLVTQYAYVAEKIRLYKAYFRQSIVIRVKFQDKILFIFYIPCIFKIYICVF